MPILIGALMAFFALIGAAAGAFAAMAAFAKLLFTALTLTLHSAPWLSVPIVIGIGFLVWMWRPRGRGNYQSDFSRRYSMRNFESADLKVELARRQAAVDRNRRAARQKGR